jgi:streptogramin lyase
VATLFAHASEPPPSLHERRPELPEAIDAVVDTALAKAPGDRFDTCHGLCRAAEEALGLAQPRLSRRRLILLTVGGAVALAAAAAVPAILLSRGDETAAPKRILPLADTSLVRVDPETADVVAAVELGGAPTQVTTGLGSVWIIDPRESVLKELDPATNALTRTIDLSPPPNYVDVGGDAAWIQTFGETINTAIVWRLDPETGSLSRFADSGYLVGAEARSVWLGNYEEIDTLAQLDTDTGRVLETMRIPRSVSGTAFGFDREMVWIAYQEATSLLRRLYPATGAVVAEIEVGPVETILVENGEVWVATNDGSVLRIDPATDQVTDEIEATRSPKLLTLGNGSLWVGDARDPVVARVDPQTGDVATIRVGGTPLSMAFGEGGLWVVVRP